MKLLSIRDYRIYFMWKKVTNKHSTWIEIKKGRHFLKSGSTFHWNIVSGITMSSKLFFLSYTTGPVWASSFPSEYICGTFSGVEGGVGEIKNKDHLSQGKAGRWAELGKKNTADWNCIGKKRLMKFDHCAKNSYII